MYPLEVIILWWYISVARYIFTNNTSLESDINYLKINKQDARFKIYHLGFLDM